MHKHSDQRQSFTRVSLQQLFNEILVFSRKSFSERDIPAADSSADTGLVAFEGRIAVA